MTGLGTVRILSAMTSDGSLKALPLVGVIRTRNSDASMSLVVKRQMVTLSR